MGGGHTHVQVLRRWAMKPPAAIRLMVVLDRPVAAYSGMVPGFVAGDYALHELEIDVVPLARRARAGVILSAARSIDPVRREIHFEDRPPIRYDLASIDVGSTIRGLDLPGVLKHTLATRPIGRFVQRIDARLAELAHLGRPARITVVGGGAAGAELAFTIDARLRKMGIESAITLITSESELLEGASPGARRAVAREAAKRGFETIPETRVFRVDPSGVVARRETAANDAGVDAPIDQEQHRASDLVVWATGAAPTSFPVDVETTALARDPEGFLEIRETLQTIGFDDLFAVGDCARLVDHRWVPRAGVYAVRQGPVLERNLRAHLTGKRLSRYRPQRDFLSLLYLGEGRALGSKWGVSLAAAAVFRLKDWIDRRFMSRFQVLDASGRPRPELRELGAMTSGDVGEDAEEMACGGCAAKLGAEPLATALGRLPTARPDASVLLGLDARDDVAATQDAEGRTTLHNIDVIRSFCDDPWLVGRVAASNALSDLFAKGGRPRHAQAVIGLPDAEPEVTEELLFQALSGLRTTLDEHGISLLGGHTTIGDELTVGLSVSGEGPEAGGLLRQAGAQAGDDLVMTGPLGTGVVLAADHMGLARGEWVLACHAAMQHANEVAGRLAVRCGAHASTDVTGFGFAGHLLTLLDQIDGTRKDDPPGWVAVLDRSAIPLLPGARLLWDEGHRSTAHPTNRSAFRRRIAGATEADEAWLFDPQTSGPLLLTIAPEKTAALIEAFAAEGEAPISKIGTLRRAKDVGAESIRIETGPLESAT